MSTTRLTHGSGFPNPPQQPQRPAYVMPWADAPPQDGREQWNAARRQELLQVASTVTLGLLRVADMQATAGGEDEPWRERPDPAQTDKAAAERAVGIALALQAACDRARPRA